MIRKRSSSVGCTRPSGMSQTWYSVLIILPDAAASWARMAASCAPLLV